MTEKLNRIILDVGGKEYEFTGGSASQPAPDSVGSEQIKDGSVQLQDLSDEARAAMGEKSTYNEEDEQLTLG